MKSPTMMSKAAMMMGVWMPKTVACPIPLETVGQAGDVLPLANDQRQPAEKAQGGKSGDERIDADLRNYESVEEADRGA